MLSFSFVSLAVLALEATAASVHLPPTPMKISLTARKFSESNLSRRALKPSTLPLKEYFNVSDLQWYGEIGVGTPPQKLRVQFDTGSTTLEIASAVCGQSCANQRTFDSSKSSTFVDSNLTGTITFDTGVGPTPVVGDEWQMTLHQATDTVSIAGISVPNVTFYEIFNQTAAFAPDPFDCIIGLGSVPDGLIGGLIQQGLPPLFGLYITPHHVGNAEITFGGIDKKKFKGDLTYAPLPNLNASENVGEHWITESTGITVNGRTSHALQAKREIIWDSGTSNIVLSKNDTEAIYALISHDIKPFDAEPGTYGIPCKCIRDLRSEISFTFTSIHGKPFHLTIPTSELNLGPFASDESMCQTLINANDDFAVIGASLLKHYYTVWDVGNQRMGFAPNGIN